MVSVAILAALVGAAAAAPVQRREYVTEVETYYETSTVYDWYTPDPNNPSINYATWYTPDPTATTVDYATWYTPSQSEADSWFATTSAVAASTPAYTTAAATSPAAEATTTPAAATTSSEAAWTATSTSAEASATSSSGYQFNTLWWSDEFDGDSLDTSVWTVVTGDGCPDLCGWGNGEVETYGGDNVAVSDGTLQITAWYSNEADKWYSGKVTTASSISRSSGRVEASIKVPTNNGAFPAFWMMPSSSGSTWPEDGEIDIMEYQETWGVIPSTLHFESDSDGERIGTDAWQYSQVSEAADSFNLYSVEWDETKVTYYRNGAYIGEYYNDGNYNDYPFTSDNPFYVIFNLALGPSWGVQPSDTTQNVQMQVDYVRWYI